MLLCSRFIENHKIKPSSSVANFHRPIQTCFDSVQPMDIKKTCPNFYPAQKKKSKKNIPTKKILAKNTKKK